MSKRTAREAGKVIGVRLTPDEVDDLQSWLETLDEQALAALRSADPRPDDERGRRVPSRTSVAYRAIWFLGLEAARELAESGSE